MAFADVVVSCIMPTSNRRGFVPRSIECFLRQDYEARELIILDDGTDCIKDLVPPDARIRYFRSERRMCVGAKRNYCCQSANGCVIAHWDDDDYYPPHRLSVELAAIEAGADLTGTSSLYYHEVTSGETFLYAYRGGLVRWVAGNTIAYRRAVWQRNGFPELQVREDLRFMLEANECVVHDLSDPALCVASIHPGNVSPKDTGGMYWSRIPADFVHAALRGARLEP